MKKYVVIQILLLVISLGFSTLYLVMSAIGKGMKNIVYVVDVPAICKYLCIFIVLLFCLKIVFRHNQYILSIGGLVVWTSFVFLNIVSYLTNGTFRMSRFDYIFFPSLVLLLANSVFLLIKATKG